ncbi:MAG: hypothetical protein RMJ98_12990 [Myxococcales bacterium]|nr:hypothetical protein [Polyangiaceae bacterium]MDW8250203.1 hypothetical protein [Myxococcales bacterium]
MPKEHVSKSYDPSLAKACLEEQEATLRAIPAGEVAIPNSDPVSSALAALALVDLVRAPDRAPRYKLLPVELFDPGTVDRLEKNAWALWQAHLEAQIASAAETSVKVPPEIFQKAMELKGHMQRLLEYHLGDHSAVSGELADIRLGSGYSDLASDLVRCARLLDLYKAELQEDRKFYHPGDAALARSLAQQILEALRSSLRGKMSLTDLRNRAWTMVARDYAELIEVSHFLFRKQPEEKARFVPLRALLYPRRSSGSSDPSPPDTPPAS